MKTKVHKQSELKTLKDKLPKSTITIFTTFSRAGEKGLSVAQMQELKRAMRSMNSEYLIAKKSLVDIATRDLKYDGVDIYGMQGSVGVVMGNENPYTVAKKLYEFAKKNQALHFFGAIVDGTFVGKEGFIEMALMPSREVLLARLLGMMMYPVSSLAMVLKQIADKKAADAPAPAPTPAPAAEPAPATEQPAVEAAPVETPSEAPAQEETAPAEAPAEAPVE
jgi:large subunit ribosomal protein L10